MLSDKLSLLFQSVLFGPPTKPMKLICTALVMLALSHTMTASGQSPQATANQINAEMARRNLEYFESYLAKCPQHEVRCLWFLGDRIGVGEVMTIDLLKSSVHTVRDVFDHALQCSETRQMSDLQRQTVQQLLPLLPASTPNIPFSDGLHIAFWHDKKLQVVTFSRVATPLVIQRLYDVGGGYIDCTYTK